MSDVTVNVSGLPFDQTAVSGVQISYAYNTIPTCTLQLVAPYIEEKASSFLCDPDSFKKQTRNSPVSVSVKTKTGCIEFEGVFDGLSFQQSPGGFSYSAVLKSKFQVLMEIYPKFVGLDPSSMLTLRRVGTMGIKTGQSDSPYEWFRSPLQQIDATGKSLIEFFIDIVKELLKCQAQAKAVSNTTAELAPILKLMEDDRYKKAVDKGIEILNDIDFEAVKNTDMKAQRCAPDIVERVIYSQDTLWDTLLSTLDYFGCMLLPGKDKLFIIPKANYMKLDGSGGGYQTQATEPNQAYPADYNSFAIDDTSYRNLRACFVLPSIKDPGPKYYAFVSQALGVYPSEEDDLPDDGSTGILVVPAPTFLIQNIDGLYVQNDQILDEIKPNKSFAGPKIESETQPKQDIKSQVESFIGSLKPIQTVLNNYAKAKFLQEKYVERGGGITMQFKPTWVPGTTGYVFSRHPGLHYNFFVTSVRHEISLGSGSSGIAVTNVSFNSCRYAGSAGNIAGTDTVELYNYDTGKMKSVQQDWLNDVGGSAVPDYND